ncbi:arginine beta-hydroxylase, Fe(II)/alpha-ketoglutarate-dependent [Exilibacterium tricleocarpae]|uniref:Arginine beta-hydroxylase, Fe(II)/alpha-ketoglutarate-dependent n=1 Tax=Exilibacterium tricleocarpae TaxID=2591008 RepID=A0A545U8F7_9GAMM|nr:guanitoxin biosynthesis L-enduracididine beta-hydroxylase GntD [Exilibacterium tricleocarpae]TQV85754.1 arginine beta-hydroxylase, Fe(II)/alpha-ketoglutarate-dependent [Exilibacterium tricleocarpae]
MSENTFVTSDEEWDKIHTLIKFYFDDFKDFNSVDFLKNLPAVAYQLPARLVKFLNDFKYDVSPSGYCIVSNLKIDDKTLGSTPPHWQLPTNNDTCEEIVVAMCLISTILGDIFGWLTQQDGRMVHDVLPIRNLEQEQLGCGSKEKLWWHTEDAFHELRGDYLMLMCLRNHRAVPTIVSRPDYSKLTTSQLDRLFEKHYTIRPDNSHKIENESESRALMRKSGILGDVSAAYREVVQRDTQPEKIAVLFGDRDDPYLRIDPYFMGEPENAEAGDALHTLIDLIDNAIVEVPLKQGECLILDNYKVVHGRPGFGASYDGTDRWLKRINITRDIRKCHQVLQVAQPRIIY